MIRGWASGDLALAAVRLLQACREEGIVDAKTECVQSMLGIKKEGVYRDVGEARGRRF